MSQSDAALPYRHPGQAFIERYGVPQLEADIWQYVEFLRQAAGLDASPPVDLEVIYRHFGMPIPLRAPLIDQQGILVDSRTGIILIKETDPVVRQRFTEGHELMELLFDAHLQSGQRFPWSDRKKEQLCDQGAAELLMPRSSFVPRLHRLKISLRTAQILADRYQTSLLATVIRMMHCGLEPCALILWHCALSRRELQQPQTRPVQKKLRVWWRTCTAAWAEGFIPKNKSIPHESLISSAYTSGEPQAGIETLNFGGGAITCRVEARPMQVGEKYCVLSLLHTLT